MRDHQSKLKAKRAGVIYKDALSLEVAVIRCGVTGSTEAAIKLCKSVDMELQKLHIEVNKNQIAIGSVAALNFHRQGNKLRRQIFTLGAGLGKSRCIITFIVAMKLQMRLTEFTVVFSHE